MALSYFYLTLDTLAPQGLTVVLNKGVDYTSSPVVTLDVGCSDELKTGIQMKIWGIKTAPTEAEATWETYSATKQITLPDGDGLKTVYVKLRDDVLNESGVESASITLNTAVPTVSIQSQDVQKISKVAPKNICTIAWFADTNITEYKVCVVNSINATHDSGTVIATANGSDKTSGVEAIQANTVITTKINGTDFELAGAVANEQSIIKVFVKNEAGTWSI